MQFLASVGSSGPFIGLFGTVYGIMNSFIGIANTNTTNLAVVAPGIAEALLATGIGLFAAIPSVIFYNFFQTLLKIWFTCPGRTSQSATSAILAVIPDSIGIATAQDLRLRADLWELSSQDLGDRWIDSKGSAVLEVPSVVVADEHINLRNPAHPDFGRIVADPPALFHFDPRLFR